MSFNLIEESGEVPLRGFRTHRWKSSSSIEVKLSEAFWSVRTKMRFNTLVRLLKLKSIFDELNEIELRCLIDAPGVLKDELWIAALRAKQSGLSMEILEDRLKFLNKVMNVDRYDSNLYYTLRKERFHIVHKERTIRKGKKYSGYARTPSSVGSKNNSKIDLPLPETFDFEDVREIDYFQFLSLGVFSGYSLEIRHPEDGSRRPKGKL